MQILSILSGVVFFVAFVPYLLAIRGLGVQLAGWSIRLCKVTPTSPKKSSWIIWGILDFITLAGMYAKDALNGQIIGACTGVAVVIVFAIKYGTPGWTRIDRYCLGGAALGIMLWGIFDSPVLGIVTSCFAGFIGSIPTFESAWNDPSHEDKLTWAMFWVSCVFAVIAIPHWTLADTAQPISYLVGQTIMMFILFIKPRL